MHARTLLAAAALVVTASLAGCDHSPAATSPTGAGAPASSTAGAAVQPGVAAGACELSPSGEDARISVTPAGGTVCADMARKLSSGGMFWSMRAEPGDPKLRLICAMTSAGQSATVRDTGSAVIGRSICSSMVSAGWQEDTSKEDEVARAQASATAAARLSAEQEKAMLAEADAFARDSAAVEEARTAVKSWPAKLTADLTKVDDALKEVKAALAQTRTDAAGGQGDNCYNVTTVTYDAQQNVEYAAKQGVGYAATQDVAADIAAARADIDKFDQAVAVLVAHPGVLTPGDADTIKTDLRSAIRGAVAHTNGAIDNANAYTATAYSIATKLATGSCAGYGPGTREPLAHIK